MLEVVSQWTEKLDLESPTLSNMSKCFHPKLSLAFTPMTAASLSPCILSFDRVERFHEHEEVSNNHQGPGSCSTSNPMTGGVTRAVQLKTFAFFGHLSMWRSCELIIQMFIGVRNFISHHIKIVPEFGSLLDSIPNFRVSNTCTSLSMIDLIPKSYIFILYFCRWEIWL